MMAKVRNRGTAVEMQVRRAVWSAGFRYRVNVRSLPGIPDIVLKRYRITVLVQGCFWHGHSCRKGRTRPSSNVEFWQQKLDGNIERDASNRAKLAEQGWKVVVIWECSLEAGTNDLVSYLRERRLERKRKEPPNHDNPTSE